MNGTNDDELAVKGMAALSLTRSESDASSFPLLGGFNGGAAGPLRATFETATDIAKIDVETFYERVRLARSVHCRHSKH